MTDIRYPAPYSEESRRSGPDATAPYAPALLRYLYLLWRHRLLIAAISLAPAAVTVLLLWLWPAKYAATFVYERPVSESQYDVLLRRFYSQENLDKIVSRLQEQQLTDYVALLNKARDRQSFDKLIRFEVAPIYPKRLQTTDPCTSEKISAFQARLLFVDVLGRSEPQVRQAAAVITGNLETVLPLYDIRNELKESIQEYKALAARIEENRFTLTMDLQKEQAKLAKLKDIGGNDSDVQGNIVLQFSDVEKSREFLPLPYQIAAIQSKIVDLQETLASDTGKYTFYLQVLELSDRLLARIEESLLTDSTVSQFLDYLSGQLRECKEQALSDHLKSYIRKTENLVLVNTRAGEKPVVHPVSRHVARNSVLAFVVFLMVALFTAVLFEYRHPPRGPVSGPSQSHASQ